MSGGMGGGKQSAGRLPVCLLFFCVVFVDCRFDGWARRGSGGVRGILVCNVAPCGERSLILAHVYIIGFLGLRCCERLG